MQFSPKHLGILILLLGALFLWPDSAHALDLCREFGGTTKQPAVTEKIVNCVQSLTQTASEEFLARFSQIMMPAVIAAIALSLVLLGTKIATGGVQASSMAGIGFITALKIGIILFLVTNPVIGNNSIISTLFDTIVGAQEVVASPFQEMSCGAGASGLRVWKCLDEFLVRIFGFGGGVTLGSGILALIVGSLFSGMLGIWFFFFAVAGAITFVLAVLRAVHVTLMAIIALGILMMISPLILPLMLFSATKSLFDKWVEMIIPVMIQPVLVMAFLAISVTTIEGAITGEVSSVRDGTGRQGKSADDKSIAGLMRQIEGEEYVYFDELFSDKAMGGLSPMISSANEMAGQLGIQEFDIGKIFTVPMIDWSKIGSSPTEQGEFIGSFIRAMAGVLLVSYFMMTVLSYVPQVSSSLAGTALSLARQPMPFERSLHGAVEGAKSGMTQGADPFKGAAKGALGGGGSFMDRPPIAGRGDAYGSKH